MVARTVEITAAKPKNTIDGDMFSAVLLACAAFAAPARTAERYSRTVSYAGQSVQRCTLDGVSEENKLAVANHFDMMVGIDTVF